MCTNPNFMIWTDRYMETRYKVKDKFVFVPGTNTNKRSLIENGDLFIEVPCGKCLECRINYCAEWSARCSLEAKKYKDNYFITLTYDDLHKPLDDSLHPEDLTQFLKNIRNKFPDYKMKFFASGEYGSLNFRPHFHIILFNCPLDDLSLEFKLKKGDKYEVHKRIESKNNNLMFSQKIFDSWGQKGMISVGKFSYDTAGYVAQYCMKKFDEVHQKNIEEKHLHKEFIRMSRRPGIGFDSFDDVDVLRGDVLVPAGLKTHYASIPRYFEKLFIKKYGDDYFNQMVRVDRNVNKIRDKKGYIFNRLDAEGQNKIRAHILEAKFIDNRKI